MNEVVKISISGIGFVFDKSAYNELKSYLDKLEQGYKNNPDGPEIISDLEARIVELILSRQNLEEVVSLPLLKEIIIQLGEPEDISENDGDGRIKNEEPSGKFPRRLYRDMENAKLGGVFSGLGNYFDINPAWLRFGFFIPIFIRILFGWTYSFPVWNFSGSLFGTFFLLYIILWIVIPVARSPRQKLEMKGKKVTASAIEEEMHNVNIENQGSESLASKLFGILGRIIVFSIKLFAIIVGVSLAIAAAAILVLIFTKTGSDILNLHLWDYDVSYLEGITSKGYMSLLLGIVLIPLVMIIYQLIRLIFNLKNNAVLMWVMGGAWLLLIAYTGIITARNVDNFRQGFDLSDSRMRLELIEEMIPTNHKGTLIVNGDTIIHNGSVVAVDDLLNHLGDKDSLRKMGIEIQRDHGRFQIKIGK